MYTETAVTEIAEDGAKARYSEAVIAEHEMEIFVNRHPEQTIVCTPSDLTELVLGRLFSEGRIRNLEEIDTVIVRENGKRVDVLLCGAEKNDRDFLKPVAPIRWEIPWIWALTGLLCKDTPLHKKTHSAHSCCLMVGGTPVYQCEDIGRHNALDKAVGYALRYGYDLRKAVIYITGRVPADMVIKMIRCRIPVIVSKEAPTQEAIRLARAYRLTLIGCAKNRRAKIFAEGI